MARTQDVFIEKAVATPLPKVYVYQVVLQYKTGGMFTVQDVLEIALIHAGLAPWLSLKYINGEVRVFNMDDVQCYSFVPVREYENVSRG